VRANADANHGKEITWEAEADIVSGLGGFIVLRDGRGIAKLPTLPPEAVYGRPLFQGLSYHDTPFAPLPQIRHVDMSAKLGDKHVYTVIALSSAGVPKVSIRNSNYTHWIGNLMTFEMTKGELARNGKLASCWF